MSERSEQPTATARGSRMDAATEAFVAHRNLLFTLAYEMLGSAVDAEDVVQETWLLWVGVDLGTVLDQRASRWRCCWCWRRSRRPSGAVFVLREVFDVDYDEIAEAVDKTPAAVRQIAHRARAHVAARRPRGTGSPAEHRAALQAFQRAVETGDLQSLLDILAPDVVALSDGGGVKHALLRPIVGADNVARLLALGWWKRDAERSVELVQINGGPGLLVRVNGEIDGVVAVRVENAYVTGAYHVRNPEKLSRMERETAVTR
ncbi:sigma factor-like helix-turn-helix DNA-binding protein [Micromonospora sp. NPDC002717]|uniref:sigma factor-like helix-turn-helix DNA-binding protein n=1 Tax=Micromonospora sp. NPDC002717 TaxID=3154424 RepID=UPI00331B397C